MGADKEAKNSTFDACTVFCYEDLLSSELLRCIKCEKFLKPPIFLLEKIGNVCSICYPVILEKDPTKLTTENTALSMLVEKLYFRCEFNKEGCDKILTYGDLQDHIETCDYKPVLCPIDKCDWVGKKDNLSIHFKSSCAGKAKCVPILSLDEIQVFTLSDDMVSTIFSEVGIFIFRLKIVNDKFYLLLYGLKEGVEFYFDIRLGTDQACSDEEKYFDFERTFSCKSITDIQKFLSFDLSYCELLQELPKSFDLNDFVMYVALKDCKNCSIVNNQLLAILQCESCSKQLKPPIYHSVTGNSICETCYIKNAFVTLGLERRNFSLEKITQYVRYSCQFCKFKYLLGSQHELTCKFRKFTCPLCLDDSPPTYYTWPNLICHLKEEPNKDNEDTKNADVLVSDTHVFCLLQYKHNSKFYFIIYDRIFVLSYNNQRGIGMNFHHFDVSIISDRNCELFAFELQFYLKDEINLQSGRVVTFTTPCYVQGTNICELVLSENPLINIVGGTCPTKFRIRIIKTNAIN